MKILHYLKRTRLEEGGVVRAVLDVCGILAEAGQEVTLMTFDDTDAPQDWTGDPGVPRVVKLDAPRVMGRLPSSAIRKASDLMRSHDVLHLHTLWTPSNGQMAAASRRVGTPYVVTIHGMLDDWCMTQRALKKKIYLTLSARRVLDGAKMVHCTASGELEQARRWFGNPNTTVIPLVFDTAPFRDLPGVDAAHEAFPVLREGRPTLLFLSRVHYKKGIEHLIDAAALLRKDGTDVDVLVAGHGEQAYVDQLTSRASDAGIGDRVHFLGMVKGVRKVSLYQACDIFVLPTSQENFGIVLPESMACETPVVTTKRVDIWPELEASGGARLVAQDASAIADVVRELLADDETRRSMGVSGRRWVMEELDGSRTVERYIDMYEGVT